MKIKIQWIYLFIILLVISKKSFANDFSGEWIWPNSTFFNSIQISVEQDNNRNNLSGYSQNQCGPIHIAGVSNNNGLSLTLNINGNRINCPTWIRLIASCQNADCTTVQGTWYDSNHLIGTLVWIKKNKKFYISSPVPGSIFSIDVESYMPSLNFKVNNPFSSTTLKWSLKIDYHWRRGKISAKLPTVTTDTNQYKPDLSPWSIIGGALTATVTHGSLDSVNNEIATSTYKIYGTNPGKYLIDNEIKDPIQASIACVESEYRQFDAPRENGQGLPLIGINERGQKVGGIGIMQIINKKYTAATLWNWRYNIKEGLLKLNDKRLKAARLHINERIRLNAERKKLVLSSRWREITTFLTNFTTYQLGYKVLFPFHKQFPALHAA